MAFRKKNRPETRPRQNGAKVNLSQFGLLEMPDFTGLEDGAEDDDDDNLEAELQAILSGQAPAKASKKPKKAIDIETIGMMAADCVKDIDEDLSDENLSGDEELLAELHGISHEHEEQRSNRAMIPPLVPTRPQTAPTPQPVLQRPEVLVPSRPQTTVSQIEKPKEMSLLETLTERQNRYKEAESAARALGESSKAKRYGRGVKTLETLIKEAKAGKPISEENIPPPVAIPKRSAPQPQPTTESTPKNEEKCMDSMLQEWTSDSLPAAPQIDHRIPEITSEFIPAVPKRTTSISSVTQPGQQENSTHQMMCARRDQYKIAALAAKKSGDMETAKSFVKISKQFQGVIEAMESGKEVDLSNMPPPPPVRDSRQASSAPPQRHVTKPADEPFQLPPEAEGPEDPSLFNAPPPPATVQEALQQRLEKFQITLKAAMVENDNSRVRRCTRIVKQYEAAIRDYNAGKVVDFDELITPPGFGPIPVNQKAPIPGPIAGHSEEKPKMANRTAPPAPAPKPVSTAAGQKPPATPPKPPIQKKLSTRSPSSLMDKQLSFLMERQKLFKAAALESKQNGDIQQAKEYLRMAKGFDPMIEATKCGLPIDATSIPTPPQLAEDYVVVEATECVPEDMDKQENFRALERDLTRQIEICLRNKEHFLKLGDVSSASKFEKFCQDTRKDLLVVQNLWKSGEQLPKFHYENRIFSMVQCHSELSDNEVQLKIMRGINLPGKPSELDSFVKIEFPYPSETPQLAKTHTQKDTNNPEYKESFKFEINRKSRTLARIFKRHAVKLEVWSKGGFLRSDTLLGTASIKLIDLEKKCSIHDSFDLMEGRKACGGKLEVVLTIREPLLAKQIEEVKEKWLVIGS